MNIFGTWHAYVARDGADWPALAFDGKPVSPRQLTLTFTQGPQAEQPFLFRVTAECEKPGERALSTYVVHVWEHGVVFPAPEWVQPYCTAAHARIQPVKEEQ